MSGNVDLVRSMYAASERGEHFPRGWAHPEIELVIALDLQPMRTEFADVVHIRDGKVIKIVVYFDRDPALADLGLEAER